MEVRRHQGGRVSRASCLECCGTCSGASLQGVAQLQQVIPALAAPPIPQGCTRARPTLAADTEQQSRRSSSAFSSSPSMYLRGGGERTRRFLHHLVMQPYLGVHRLPEARHGHTRLGTSEQCAAGEPQGQMTSPTPQTHPPTLPTKNKTPSHHANERPCSAHPHSQASPASPRDPPQAGPGHAAHSGRRHPLGAQHLQHIAHAAQQRLQQGMAKKAKTKRDAFGWHVGEPPPRELRAAQPCSRDRAAWRGEAHPPLIGAPCQAGADPIKAAQRPGPCQRCCSAPNMQQPCGQVGCAAGLQPCPPLPSHPPRAALPAGANLLARPPAPRSPLGILRQQHLSHMAGKQGSSLVSGKAAPAWALLQAAAAVTAAARGKLQQ